jgi:N-acetylmuramoyl-L-alanine amidase
MAALCLIFIFFIAQSGDSAQQGRYTVVIDPAHGGDDPGVVVDNLREKDITLKIALLMAQEVKKTADIDLHLIRSTDKTMTVSERYGSVKVMNPHCFLSLHVNAGFGKKAAGYEVYFPGFRYPANGGGDSAAILKDMEKNSYLNNSVELAHHILAGLESVFPRNGRGLRDAPNPLLDTLTCPGLLVEIGFATQTEERKNLSDEETQRKIARALMKGLRNYLQKAP